MPTRDLRPLHPTDLPLYRAHLERHFAESGRGEPVFAPFSKELPADFDRWQLLCQLQLELPVRAPGWRRTWCLWRDDLIVGHAELTGPELAVSLHRCNMGVGLERPHRGQGRGQALTETALEWARTQPELSWVDLAVFAQSQAAYALYCRLGFREVGRREDRHRIDGQSVDEIMMVLGLESSGPSVIAQKT